MMGATQEAVCAYGACVILIIQSGSGCDLL
jgi:hypothetical protein